MTTISYYKILVLNLLWLFEFTYSGVVDMSLQLWHLSHVYLLSVTDKTKVLLVFGNLKYNTTATCTGMKITSTVVCHHRTKMLSWKFALVWCTHDCYYENISFQQITRGISTDTLKYQFIKDGLVKNGPHLLTSYEVKQNQHITKSQHDSHPNHLN